ncbi:MAG TPA: ribonuclease Z [Prolixibacteraceae bacterium]|jgi:ribonuclease Z|nr:ribonuclease Z [Prolixibacteraceae bacterium]
MSFKLTVLGSGSALPTSEKFPTAHVLNVHERFFLIDCGEGTQIQLRRYRISIAKIKHIFISHLHGDHFYGLIGLISTRNLLGIKSDLHIYAHSEIKRLLDPQINFMKGELGYNILFHPLNFKAAQVIFSDKKVEVTSFPLRHSIPVCGFLFQEKQALPNLRKDMIEQLDIPIRDRQSIKEGGGFTDSDGHFYEHLELTIPPVTSRSYAYCTDTTPFEPALEFITGASILYHEATFQSDMEEWAAKTFHSTAQQAGMIARRAGVKQLLIGHFSNRYDSDESFLDEARREFKETYLAREGKTYRIEENRSS